MKPGNSRRTKNGLRGSSGLRSAPYMNRSLSNLPRPESEAVQHAVRYVNKHGRVTTRQYHEATGAASIQTPIVRLGVAADAGFIRRIGEGSDAVYERIEEVEDAD